MLQKFLTMKALCGAKGGSSGGGSGGSGGGGGSSVSPKDVNFYDYDGTCLHAYTVKQAQAMTEMPPLPEQPGLICQGWNWSLEDIKAHDRAVDVGAMYITDDGTTRIYIRLEEGRLSPVLGICPNGTVTVDWGDGTAYDSLTGTSPTSIKWTPAHAYAKPGDYVIRLTVDGQMGFADSSSSTTGTCILRYTTSNDTRNKVYQNAVRKIEIGNGVTSIRSNAFNSCTSLYSITIPNSVTNIESGILSNCCSLSYTTIPNSVASIGSSVFATCYSLASVAIPNGITSIEDYTFSYCQSLAAITIPNSVTSIGKLAFQYCQSLAAITIPNSVTSIGSSAFRYCYSLDSINIPNGVTSIGSSIFTYCYNLSSITIPNSVTSIENYVFDNCKSLASIKIPNGVTSIPNYLAQDCTSLSSIMIPDGVTSVGQYAFNSCTSLASIVFPSSVTNIYANAFFNCHGMSYYDFTKHTAVPKLSNTNAFTNIKDDCEIRVPAALYDTWIAATNWATYASYIKAV